MDPKQRVGFRALKTEQFVLKGGCLLHEENFKKNNFLLSWVFLSCGSNLGYILELQRGCPFETLVCSLKSGTCLGMSDNSGM